MAEEKKYEYVLPKGFILRSRDGEYEIKRVLGQGGFGITYLASRAVYDKHIFLGRIDYAIKEFFMNKYCYREKGSAEMLCSPANERDVKDSLKDFISEARRLNSICQGNPNIVNVNEVFEANGTAYYVMEFINGGSLRDYVKKNGVLGEQQALAMIRPIAEAVNYIHVNHNLLHLDIKPDNIILRDNGDGKAPVPILIDFGISVHFDSNGKLTTSHPAANISEGYSPMEMYVGVERMVANRKQLRDNGLTLRQKFPSEADVYALGATLFFMITGKDPYDANTINRSIIERELPKDISDKTRSVILSAMEKDWERRTDTARSFLKGFEERYTLQPNHVVYNPGSGRSYRILSIADEGDCYIHYVGIVNTGDDKHGDNDRLSRNRTKRSNYDIYECYDRSQCRRMKDESVVMPVSSSVLKQRFERTMFEKGFGLNVVGDNVIRDGEVVLDSFHAGNTSYVVVKRGWKPTPAWIVWIKEHRRLLAMCGAACVVAVGIIYGIMKVSDMMEARRIERQKYSALLTKAINTNDSTVLAAFFKNDSARAFLPLANLYLERGDTAHARTLAEQAIRRDFATDAANELLAKITPKEVEESKETKTSEPQVEESNPQEQPTVVADNSDAEAKKKAEEERKKKEAEEKKKKEEQAKQENSQVSATAQLETALNSQDWKTLETLANKGETRAADALANHFVNGVDNVQNNKLAEKWANKASSSVRRSVRHKLYLRGYLTEDN